MPLNLRASQKLQDFNVGVSYRLYDNSGKFLDARNVNTIQKRLDTRFGSSRFNSITLGGAINSFSAFTKSDGSRYTLAKVGQYIYSVSENGEKIELVSGLPVNSRHRAETISNRHIIAVEGHNRLYSFNGTIFTRLGSEAPPKPSVTLAAGVSLIDTNKYQVAVSYIASSIGYESNATASDEITTATPNLQINVTDISAPPENALVDKIAIYLKNVTADSEFIFVAEVPVSTISYAITEPPLSSQITQEVAGPPPNGASFLAIFNNKLVLYGGNDFPNEAIFSEPDLPDAFNPLDDGLRIVIPGKGRETGVAVGLFNDSVLDPYLVFFKNKSVHVYSEIGDSPRFVTISNEIGCVSADTIQIKNGAIYFLSEEGWRGILNGRFITDNQGDAITLANGDIDDIFRTRGQDYEVNRNGMKSSFSVYYPALDQYITWVSEGQNYTFNKAYCYEFNINGFKPYTFAVPATCACIGEDSQGRDVVLFGTSDGFIMKHSLSEPYSDRDSSNTEVSIDAYAIAPWIPKDGDFDATYNYRELIIRATSSENPINVKTFLDFDITNIQESDYSFSDPNPSFTLDVDNLDDDSVTLSDGRVIVTARADVNRVGESLAIGFYQNSIGANMALLSMQIDSSKNGNRNRAVDSDNSGNGGFDSEDESYFPDTTSAVQQCADYLQQIQTLIANITGSIGDVSFSGFSARFNEAWSSDGVEDTFAKIIQLTYTAPLISLTGSGSGTVREKGASVSSVTLAATTTKRSDPIAKVEFFQGATLIDSDDPATFPNGGTVNYVYSTPFSDNISFNAKATDDGTSGGPSEVTSNTVSFVFVYPYYFGAGVPALSAASVAGLTKDIRQSTASLNKSFTTSNGDVYYFAYPASYGALTSIKDENNFETIGDWTLRTENITGLDASAQSYRIYEFNNPVVAGSTNYTFIR